MGNRQFGVVHRCGCGVCARSPRGSVAGAHTRINRLVSTLDEKNARRVVGFLALEVGHGGVALMALVTGLSRNTIARGQAELEHKDAVPAQRVRAVGGGRPPLEKKAQGS